MLKDKIAGNIKDNQQYIKEALGESDDIIYRNLIIAGLGKREALVVYIKGLTDIKMVEASILAPLMGYSGRTEENIDSHKGDIAGELIKGGVLTTAVKSSDSWSDLLDSLLAGTSITFIEGCEYALIHSTEGWKDRAVSEPVTENEVRGPKDGFVEDLRTNTALIRRRIKDYKLRFETMRIGERTKSDITLAYIDTIVDKEILEEVRKRLGRIKIDGILAAGYIQEFIEDSPYSPFPQTLVTERPDKVCSQLLEGRIGIIVDGTPFVIIAPATFWMFIQAPGDYFEKFYVQTFFRFIRLSALILSLTLTPLYLLLASYHQEMIPTSLALRIAAGREGVPFPSVLEVLFMEISFEIMREAGLRLPRPIGQTVSIVGALVVGEAAVTAGLVGPTLVIFVALAGISSFAIPLYSVSVAIRVLRFPLILITGSLGILGFLVGTIALTLHLLSLRSFGVPYLSPVNPWRGYENKDIALRLPRWMMNKRPKTAGGASTEREESETLKPAPPDNKEVQSSSSTDEIDNKKVKESKNTIKDRKESKKPESEQLKTWKRLKRRG